MDKMKRTAHQIASKYVHGIHNSLTDAQEIKDMATEIESYAKEYHQYKSKTITIDSRQKRINEMFENEKEHLQFLKDNNAPKEMIERSEIFMNALKPKYKPCTQNTEESK